MEQLDKQVEKTEIIDEEIKGGLSDLLEITLSLKHAVLGEIKNQQQILKNFEKNQNEYMQTVADFEVFEQDRFQREMEALQATLKQQTETFKDL